MKELLSFKLAASNLTATGTGTEVDLGGYLVEPGRRNLMATLTAFNGGGNVATDTYAIDVKLQESPTTVDSDFTDVTGGAFTQVTEAATTGTPEQIFFDLLAGTRYVRESHTVTGGTGTCTIATVCELFGTKRLSG